VLAIRDFIHIRGFRDLLAAEPPVVFIRVVLPVIEAPLRRGLALSHIVMLSLTCKVAANQALSRLFRASKCRCIKGFRCG
jgi:hypothetical protein